MLDDRKILAIQYLAEGEKPKTEIAKLVGISRQTVYDWLDDDEFKAELDRRLQQRKVLVEKIIDSKLEEAVKSLWELAKTTKNARVKAQTLQYLIDRALGKATSKLEVEAVQQKSANVDDDILEASYEDYIDIDEEEEKK